MQPISPITIIEQLAANADVFRTVLTDVPAAMIRWKPTPRDWCLLEVVCHLHDEEREDFRARVKNTLADPTQAWQPIDPQDWIQSRNYMQQDFASVLKSFLAERASSVDWLRSLDDPQWNRTYEHEILGSCTAGAMLENWLAHDYLHLRQINRRKYGFLQAHCENALKYAGDW